MDVLHYKLHFSSCHKEAKENVNINIFYTALNISQIQHPTTKSTSARSDMCFVVSGFPLLAAINIILCVKKYICFGSIPNYTV